MPASDADRSPSLDAAEPATRLQAEIKALERTIETSRSADRVARARRKLATLTGIVQTGAEQPGQRHTLTRSQARDFARMLTAGLPATEAVLYFVAESEELSAEAITRLAWTWQRSADVLAAIADLNGGAWVDLPEDRRLAVALDKHFAELAYYLYTTSFTTAAGAELGKLNTARQALRDKLAGGMDEDSPLARFMRDLIEGKTPPQLTKAGMVSIPTSAKTTKTQES